MAQDTERDDSCKKPIFPAVLINGLRESLEAGLTGKQLKSLLKLILGVEKIGAEMTPAAIMARCSEMIETIEEDIVMERMHGK